jgi:hypothetical protein
VKVFVQLLLDGGQNLWMPVANIADPNAGNQVHIFFPIWTVHVDSFCLFYFYHERKVSGLREMGKENLTVIHFLDFSKPKEDAEG